MNGFKHVLKILLLIFLSSCALFSQNISLENQNPINLLKEGEVYVDKNSVYSFEELYNSESFLKTQDEFINLGYSFESSVWLRFTISNDTNKTQRRYIAIDNTMLDTIELYTPSIDGGYSKELSGVFSRNGFDNVLYFNFPITLKASESQSYYLKVSSSTSPLFFKAYLYNERDFYKKEISRQMFYTLFIGAMLILIVYNFSLFIFSKDKTYLYYVLYMIASLGQYQTYTSMGLYMYSEDTINYVLKYEAYFGIFYMTFLTITMILFSRSFLETHRYKKIDMFLKSMIVLNVTLLLFNTKENSLLDIAMYIEYLMILSLILIGIYLYYKKNDRAGYFIVGWGVMLSGVIGLLLHSLGIVSVQYYFYYIFEVPVLFEATLFSVVLASRLKTLSQELLEKERKYTIELESTVKKRTQELDDALKSESVLRREIQHRVKNNMQFIISLFKLRLSPFANANINAVVKEVTYKIMGMAKAHDMLYAQKVLNNIDANEYFMQLIGELKKGYETKHIRFDVDIRANLDSQSLIYCGLIVNEVIINALKYAFEGKKEGVISLSLYKNENAIVLEIADNGVGMDEDKKESFGSEMIKALVDNELKGTLKLETKQGVRYMIYLPC